MALVLLLAACETVVDVPPPPHTPELVAQAFFTADSLWAVRVTHTVPFTSAEAPGFVDSATVEIWTGDRLVAQPVLADSGTYVATGPGAQTGVPYTLRVSAPGYPGVEGHDALPAPPRILDFRERAIPPTDSTSRRRLTRIELTIEDPPGEHNLYGLLLVQARWTLDRRTGQVKSLPPALFPFESDDPVLGESLLDFLDTDKTIYREAFFPDDPFDGRTHTIELDFQYDASRPDAPVELGRVFALVVLTVSDDFYAYWTTAGRQFLTNENPFAEPLRVASNLSRGFGVFAGLQYRLYPLRAGTFAPAADSLCGLVGGRLPICNGLEVP